MSFRVFDIEGFHGRRFCKISKAPPFYHSLARARPRVASGWRLRCYFRFCAASCNMALSRGRVSTGDGNRTNKAQLINNKLFICNRGKFVLPKGTTGTGLRWTNDSLDLRCTVLHCCIAETRGSSTGEKTLSESTTASQRCRQVS
jgi:hypothetical protein